MTVLITSRNLPLRFVLNLCLELRRKRAALLSNLSFSLKKKKTCKSMRQLGWRKAWSGGLVFHTVDNRPAEGDRTNGEGCGLISYADPGIPGGYKDAR